MRCLSCEDKDLIFVYGANASYIHGAGAALHAKLLHGAKNGIGPFFGNSYGIITKSKKIENISLTEIEYFVKVFIRFARENPDKKFFITEIGTGLAGKSHEDMAIMFKNAPDNCIISEKWRHIIDEGCTEQNANSASNAQTN